MTSLIIKLSLTVFYDSICATIQNFGETIFTLYKLGKRCYNERAIKKHPHGTYRNWRSNMFHIRQM